MPALGQVFDLQTVTEAFRLANEVQDALRVPLLASQFPLQATTVHLPIHSQTVSLQGDLDESLLLF